MIQLHDLDFGYEKSADLFKGLSCQLQAGNVCGLLGKNGAGKTSLLKIIAGLLFADAGNCQVFGFDVVRRQPEFLRDIYFVAEDLFVPQLTANTYVNLYAPFYTKFDRQLFSACMSEFSIASDKVLAKLSYGQKKKFLISFALATNCRLTIFDEPTNGLDIPSKSQFRKLIASNMTDDKLFIISTHQVHDVEKLVDRVVILDEGKIILNATMDTINQRLTVEQKTAEPTPGSCLYVEKNIGGYTVVSANQTADESSIDLSLLFNTVLANKSAVEKLLSGEKS